MARTLAAEVAALAALMQTMNDRAEEDRDERKLAEREASNHRAAVAERLHALTAASEALARRMDRAEAVTMLVTDWRSRLTGALLVLGLVGTPIITLIVYFWERLLARLWP
ncbi:MAG: hypothetical protein V4712_17760 [Pseudomonadota bacterium]